MVPIPAVLRQRNFRLYLVGIISSQIGTRATFAAVLYHVYQLTDSTLHVGLVGLAQIVSLLALSPAGGVVADRLDRRRLLQLTQLTSFSISAALGIITISGAAQLWHILLAVLLNSAAWTFENPARLALIPAVVGDEYLVEAFAFANPARELAMLLGPALAGALLYLGPGVVYVVDAATYLVLIAVLAAMRLHAREAVAAPVSVGRSIVEGVAFIGQRPVVWQAMLLDLIATVFGAYRVLLPALAAEVFVVGPAGYGLLAAAPSAGAIAGSALVFVLARRVRHGTVILIAIAGYGLSVVGLAQAPFFVAGLVAATMIGLCDALGATMRNAMVQLETPDELRGRVSATHQITARGGPNLGDLTQGAAAAVLGPVLAMSLGGLLPIAAVAAAIAKRSAIARYDARPQRR